ncbi:MAG: bifunctional adenosylcobinamide kinase/adenosylcobinamide-phosphate guanylyltransferase [Selenomonadaceae bacterium]
MGKIILVTGGARSGKSKFAEEYVAKHGKNIAYIATAQIYDEEMRYRVSLHRSRRPELWQTYEAPFEAEKVIAAAGKIHDMILFDCLTLYLSNMLCKREDISDHEGNYILVKEAIAKLLQQAKRNSGTIVFVTNEVGQGIVPENKLSREYRDLAGLMNQMIAQEAAKTYLVICGIPVNIRKIAENMGE